MHFSDVEVGKQLIVGNGTYYDTLGLGEKEDDLQIFEAEKFAEAFTQIS